MPYTYWYKVQYLFLFFTLLLPRYLKQELLLYIV